MADDETPDSGSPGDTKKVLFLTACFFWTFGITNMCYLLPVYYRQEGFAPKQVGLLVSAFYLTSVTLRPFLGNVVQWIGFKRMLLLGSVVSVAGALGMAASGPGFAAAFVARAALGLGSALCLIALATYQALAFSEGKRGRAYSLIMAGGLLPMMTLVPLAEWMLHNGYSRYYIIMPSVSAAAALILAPFIPDLDKPPVVKAARSWNPFRQAGDCLRLPTFRLSLFAFFLFSLSDATAAFMADMTESYGLMASLFLSSNALVGVAVRVLCARLLDKYPRWKLSGPCILVTAGTLILASVNPGSASLLCLGLIFGVGMGFGFPLHLALVSDGIPAHLQAQAVSLSWFLMGLAFALAPLLSGWLGERYGPVTTFRILCAALLVGAVLSMLLMHRHHRAAREADAGETR